MFTYHALARNIDRLAHRMSVKSVLNQKKAGADELYALGSVLLVLANRPDLARLAYCSAAIRGHSLAAASLLDFGQSSAINEVGTLSIGLTGDSCDSFDRSLLFLQNGVQGETLEKLIQAIRSAADHTEDAIERILFMARLVTVLRGYGRLGRGTRELQYIELVADIVCGEVQHGLVKGTVGDAASLINMIHDRGTRELGNYRRPVQRCAGVQRKKKYKAGERKELLSSGVIGRMRREYLDLLPGYREVLILRLAGLRSGEIANALGYQKMDTDEMFAEAIARLQEAQRGEQVPAARILSAEVDSCFSAEIPGLLALATCME